ncbi:MAG: peptidase dimerization domain-containing protein [Betaproteobacteria bacterium]
MIRRKSSLLTTLLLSAAIFAPVAALAEAPPGMKQEAQADVDSHAKLVQEMVDSVFSFAEPGFQEYRTQAYLTDILEKNGFKITKGIAGIPTAWTATWGEGGPLIALGADEDDLLGVSQYPGVPFLEPMVDGAPGHGEGHNTMMPAQIAAALAVKAVMEAHHLKGRLLLWPGIAEELLGSKAFFVRDGVFKGVDACIFTHVASGFGTSYGPNLRGSGLVSVEYTFHGKTAHAAGDPWDGHSALAAAELMDMAWQFQRQFLHISQRSHDVISNGGGQPNIVPGIASVWYYYRDYNFKSIRNDWATGDRIAKGVAMATDTTVTEKTLGAAAPQFGNKILAEVAEANIKAVGMPKWTAADQAFTKQVQEGLGRPVEPLHTEVSPLRAPQFNGVPTGGPSSDLGDVTWTVPTITISEPSNIPNMIGHNATSAIAEATPIAHKGAVADAKAIAMTVLDLMTTPELLAQAKSYFDTDQQKYDHYDPFLTATDVPAIHLNDITMQLMRPKMEPFYYDASKYKTYLDQLGISYPYDAATSRVKPPSK